MSPPAGASFVNRPEHRIAPPQIDERERDNILRCAYILNSKAKKGVSIDEIKQTYFIKHGQSLKNASFWGKLSKHIPQIHKLPNNTYVVGVRRLLCQFVGRLNYEMSYYYSTDTQNKIIIEKKRILQILEEINYKDVDIEDFSKINTKHSAIFNRFLELLLESKKQLETEIFSEKLLLTESKLYNDEVVVSHLPNALERAFVLDKLLDIVHSANLAFAGTYTAREGGNLVYFYIDLEFFSKGEELLLGKIIENPSHKTNAQLQDIVKEIKNYGRKRKFGIFIRKFKKISTKLKNIRTMLEEEDKPINSSFEQIVQEVEQLGESFSRTWLDYKKEEAIFDHTNKDQLKDPLNSAEDDLGFLKGRVKSSPLIYKRFLESHVMRRSFLNIDEDHEVIQVAYKTAHIQLSPQAKKKVIAEMWHMFFRALQKHLMRYNIAIDYKSKSLYSPIILHYKELMLHKDDDFSATYLTDPNKNIEVKNPEALLSPKGGKVPLPKQWLAYYEYIPIMIRAQETYYKVIRIFSTM